MYGTLIAALEVRQVKLAHDRTSCEVEGTNEVVDGLPVLREIHVRYRLRVPAETRERVDRALATHQAKCPTAASLKDAVQIRWSAEIEHEA
jgi:organic hydroperoxide reductase OsmC/OhrA